MEPIACVVCFDEISNDDPMLTYKICPCIDNEYKFHIYCWLRAHESINICTICKRNIKAITIKTLLNDLVQTAEQIVNITEDAKIANIILENSNESRFTSQAQYVIKQMNDFQQRHTKLTSYLRDEEFQIYIQFKELNEIKLCAILVTGFTTVSELSEKIQRDVRTLANRQILYLNHSRLAPDKRLCFYNIWKNSRLQLSSKDTVHREVSWKNFKW